MKIIVFGASGATGKLLIEQGLAWGHQMVAFVRTPAKVTITNPYLQVVQGDIYNAESIKQAVDGCDAVLSVLGPDALDNVKIYSESAKSILAAMAACAVRRLVYVTSANVPDGVERSAFADELRNGYLREAYADMRRAEAEIMQSNVDWTIVRPGGYTDEPYTTRYRVDLSRLHDDADFVSRADIADFMMSCVHNGQYIHAAPFVGAIHTAPPQWEQSQ